MAFAWANTFVAANAVSGMSSGNQTAIDEWPWTSDDCFIQNTSLGTGTVTFTFDMSAGPGDKKGFRVWFRSHVDNSNGYSITAIRLKDGTTTLWTNSSPGISVTETTFAASKIRVIDIPDSAMSTNPAINNLILEFDVANLNAGNNRFRFTGLRLSKSPFTSAQETAPPASLAGADFSCYKASDLAVLGAVDTEAIVVWPDASGKGRHLLRKTGTTSLFEDDTIDYVSFPSGGGSVFFSVWGTRVTGNHIWHTQIYPEDTGVTQGVFSYNASFAGAVNPPADPNDKNILGIDDEGAGDKFLLMSGDGSSGSHKYGATTVTFGAWVRVTEWIVDSGNDKMWLNDAASPDVDAASGSNDMFSVTYGNRESEDRPFQGRSAEFWWINGAGFTEADIDAARDEWVNGPATGETVVVAASLQSLALAATTDASAGTSVAGVLPALGLSAATAAQSAASVAGTLPALTLAAQTDAAGTVSVGGGLPALELAAQTDASADVAVAGTLPALSLAVSTDAASDIAVDGSLPALVLAANLSDVTQVHVAASLPALDLAAALAASADVAISGGLPGLTLSAILAETVTDTITVSGNLPALELAAQTVHAGAVAVAGTLPTLGLSVSLAVGTAVDMDVMIGSMQTGWSTGTVAQRWNAGGPNQSWRTGGLTK